MASPASVGKHPIHPMLIPFPIALWIFSLISDLIYGMGWGGIVWKETAFYTMAGGLIGALAAAIPGYLDYRTTTVPAIQKSAVGICGSISPSSCCSRLTCGYGQAASPAPRCPSYYLSSVSRCWLCPAGWAAKWCTCMAPPWSHKKRRLH